MLDDAAQWFALIICALAGLCEIDQMCYDMSFVPQGVDFYFSSKSHALKFVDFLQTVVPVRFRQDKQLVSHNEHSSTYNYKFTFSVEIVPICKVRNEQSP